MCDPGKRNVNGVAPLTTGLENSTALDSSDVTRRIILTYDELKNPLITIPYYILERLWANSWSDEIIQLVKTETSDRLQASYVPIPVTIASEGNTALLELLIKEVEIDLSITDGNGNNSLLVALKNGHTETASVIISKAPNLAPVKNLKGESTVRFVARNNLGVEMVKLLVENGANPDEPDENGNTPLVSALREKHQSMVEYLVRDLKCKLGHKNNNGGTPFADELTSCFYEKNEDRCIWLLMLALAVNERAKAISMVPQNALNLACKNRMINLVELLVQWYNCDPLQPSHGSIGEQTSILHTVFERKDVEIASILLAHRSCKPNYCIKNGTTVSQLAEGNKELSSLLEQSNDPFVCQARKPVKVFVLGNSANGKTSLVKVLRGSMNHEPLLGSLRTVSQPKHCTTGILPYKIQHKDFGSIILYDCAGQQCYQSSLAAIIETLVESLPSVFIIVVDIDQKKEEIVKELFQWTHFLNCVTGKSPRQSHVIVAGSKADSSSLNPWGFQNCCTSWINDSINSLIFGGGIMLDCRRLQSRGLTDLSSIVSQSCAIIRSENPFKPQFHHLSLYAYCMEKMADYMYFTIGNLKKESSGQEDLSLEDETLLCSLKLLDKKGLIIYLENDENNIDSDYVILDPTLLLHNIGGCLFASPNDKQYLSLNDKNGFIPVFHLEKLSFHDVEMVCLFLKRFSLSTDCSIPDTLFVPALVEQDCLKLNGLMTRSDGYWFGMILEFKLEYSHLQFIDRYLHVLQLEVMDVGFVNGCVISSSSTSLSSTENVLNVSKNAIHWKDQNEVECLFEISEDKRSLLFIIACPQGKEMHLVLCRSRLYKMVRNLRERFFKSCSSNIVDSLISGSDLLQYPNINIPNACKTSLANVFNSVLLKKDPVEFTARAVLGKHTTDIAMDLKLKDLLYFDTYFDIPLNILSNLVKLHDGESIPDHLTKELANTLAPLIRMNPATIAEIFQLVVSDDIVSDLSQETANKLISEKLIIKWTENAITASELLAILNQFTIFSSLDSQMMVCLLISTL